MFSMEKRLGTTEGERLFARGSDQTATLSAINIRNTSRDRANSVARASIMAEYLFSNRRLSGDDLEKKERESTGIVK